MRHQRWVWQLYQFPLCPFSRKVRLVLGEKRIPFDLVRENPWDRREAFAKMNRLCQTPVLHDPEGGITLVDSRAICDYLEDTSPKPPLMMGSALFRAEVRRLSASMDEEFYVDVTLPFLHEKVKRGLLLLKAPDNEVLYRAMQAADRHLDEIDYLIDRRAWLAGATLSLADLAGAAHISVADYLGAIDWSGHEQARGWYSTIKSRPSFRSLLSERMNGIDPPPHYSDIDA